MLVLVILMAVGRVLANMHWPVDVIGGVAFAVIFTDIYYYTLRHKGDKNE